jgi:ferric iron reductase protein FhuF
VQPDASQVLIDDQAPVTTVAELLRPSTLDDLLLKVYGAQLMASHKPVLVSQWSKYYFMQLIPPVVSENLLHGLGWPLGLDQLGFAVNGRGVLDGIRFYLDPAPVPSSDDSFRRFAPLLINLQQVIEALSAYGDVAPSVLWGNAGDYLETCLRQLTAVSEASLASGYGLLCERTWPDGRRNPLFNSISYTEQPGDQAARRLRRSCCLSHRVEWVGRCEHCPLHNASPV